MAFDGIVTKAIVQELNNCLINGKINKIFEPNKNEILLGIYSSGKNYALNISIEPTNYKINLTTHTKQNPQNVLNFCMVLRKNLIGATIKRIYTNGLERIIFIDFNCYNELNDLITNTLVVELMGKHSNIILLNSNSIVIDSLRHLNKFDNSTRDIFPGSRYINIVSQKQNFFNVKTFDEFYQTLEINDQDEVSISKVLSDKYNGFSKNNIVGLLENIKIKDSSKDTSDLKKIYTYLKNIMKNLEEQSNKQLELKQYKDKKSDYYIFISENIINTDNLKINFFIDDFYYKKETNEQIKNYKDNVLRLVLNHVKKVRDKINTKRAIQPKYNSRLMPYRRSRQTMKQNRGYN